MTSIVTGTDALKPAEDPKIGIAETVGTESKISVVTTLYNSAPYLEEFYRRTLDQLRQLPVEYEFVLVDDGSPDHVLQIALGLMRRDPKLKVVELSRNFGHHKALMTGLEHACGDLIFLIDVDLEEPPESLTIFFRKMTETAADVVFGVQDRRSDPWFRRLTGRSYYWLYNLLAKNQMAPNQLTARLMRRPYVNALLLHREHLFAIEVLWQITGFVQVPCSINKTAYKGSSAYTFVKRLRLFVNAIAMSSRQPLVFIAYLGLLATCVCVAYILFILVQYFFFSVSVSGWTSVIVSTWLLGGIIIFCLGIISIYLSIIFEEVKMRPYVIVKTVHEAQSAALSDQERGTES